MSDDIFNAKQHTKTCEHRGDRVFRGSLIGFFDFHAQLW